ncbi:MAG: YraN family protein [Phycisphaerales bacterium JB038]
MNPLRLLLGARPTDTLGRRGETVAARHLRRQGYRILQRNLRLKLGEVDLLCQDPDGRTLVIVEVKTRRADAVPAEANITAAKKRKLITLAQALGGQPDHRERPLRIDVVAVHLPDRGKPTIRHHVNAITLG